MTKKIDTHAHLGECCVFGLLSTEEDMLRRMEECGVDATIVQPYPGATTASKTHDRIAELCAKHPGRFFGIASTTPHGPRDAYDRVMLGADLPSNVPVEYAKYKALELAPEVYERVLGGTAIDVFMLKW